MLCLARVWDSVITSFEIMEVFSGSRMFNMALKLASPTQLRCGPKELSLTQEVLICRCRQPCSGAVSEVGASGPQPQAESGCIQAR